MRQNAVGDKQNVLLQPRQLKVGINIDVRVGVHKHRCEGEGFVYVLVVMFSAANHISIKINHISKTRYQIKPIMGVFILGSRRIAPFYEGILLGFIQKSSVTKRNPTR